MEINDLRNELSIRSKNGIAFLLAATLVWSIVLVIFLLPIEIRYKNIFTFYSTCILFPLAILFSKLIKADWKINDNPLGTLGIYLNIAQLIYFPIIFWAFSKNPT